MSKNLTIIGNATDAEAIETLRPNLEANGYTLIIATPADEQAVSAPVAVLWIKPDTEQDLYNSARKRMANGLKTINMFAEPTSLNQNQKNSIGRNQSIFASLRPGAEAAAICDLLYALPYNSWDEKEIVVEEDGSSSIEESGLTNNYIEENSSYIEENSSVLDSTETESQEELEKTAMGPGTVFVFSLIMFLGYSLIAKFFEFKCNEIRTYIATFACLFFTCVFISCLKDWRKLNGKKFWSWIVLAINWILLIRYIIAFFNDASNWINM